MAPREDIQEGVAGVGSAVALADIVHCARLRVLRGTVSIAFVIALGDLVGSLAGSTTSRAVTGPVVLLAAAWCVVWLVAAVFAAATAQIFVNWRTSALVLGVADAASVALTGGVGSPLLAVCMYAGWVASVVVPARAAITVSASVSASVFAGYMLAGASLGNVFAGPARYNALANVLLPILAGVVGALLAAVTNGVFRGLPGVLYGLRTGAPASTVGLTALLAGRSVAMMPPARLGGAPSAATAGPLTPAEANVVSLIAAGYRPKQIARIRGVALSTVRSQIKSAKRKTEARTLDELVALTWVRLP